MTLWSVSAEFHLALSTRVKAASDTSSHDVDSLPTVVRTGSNARHLVGRCPILATNDAQTTNDVEVFTEGTPTTYEIKIAATDTQESDWIIKAIYGDVTYHRIALLHVTPTKPGRVVVDGASAIDDDVARRILGFRIFNDNSAGILCDYTIAAVLE